MNKFIKILILGSIIGVSIYEYFYYVDVLKQDDVDDSSNFKLEDHIHLNNVDK
nr:MAG TPA: Transcriptional activator RinB [Herelleviridae sp.]